MKRLAKFLLYVGVAIVVSPMAFAGAGSHGGESIYCKPSRDNDLRGTYFLDYILSYRPNNNNVVKVSSWQESTQRIISILKHKLPDLGASLQDFITLYKSDTVGKPRMWIGGFQPRPIDDQDIDVTPPENCLGGISQTISREPRPNHLVLYKYYEPHLQAMEKTGPEQISYTLVHEFLRDYIDDAKAIRSINQLFHSMDLDKVDPLNLENFLVSMGMPYFSTSYAGDGTAKIFALRKSIEFVNSNLGMVYPEQKLLSCDDRSEGPTVYLPDGEAYRGSWSIKINNKFYFVSSAPHGTCDQLNELITKSTQSLSASPDDLFIFDVTQLSRFQNRNYLGRKEYLSNLNSLFTIVPASKR